MTGRLNESTLFDRDLLLRLIGREALVPYPRDLPLPLEDQDYLVVKTIIHFICHPLLFQTGDQVPVANTRKGFKRERVRHLGACLTQGSEGLHDIVSRRLQGRSLIIQAKVNDRNVSAIIDTAAMITLADASLFPIIPTD
jgi:hypothetical protein